MEFYTKNHIMAALHLKYCEIFPSDTYRFNIWMSKNKHFHLSILKFNQQETGKYEKLNEIRNVANDVYEDLSDNNRYFNQVYNPNVRKEGDIFSVLTLLYYIDTPYNQKIVFFSPFVDMKIEVKYYHTSENCKVPTKATADSAGYDLYAAEKK